MRVIYTWAERPPRGEGYVFRLQAPAEALTGDIDTDVAIINREVERMIPAVPAAVPVGLQPLHPARARTPPGGCGRRCRQPRATTSAADPAGIGRGSARR